jgi:LppP/LprE lipoprotein
MPRNALISACALAGLVFAGCGSGAKTVSVAGEPDTTSQPAATTPARTTTAPATTPTSPDSGAATGPTTTRSAPEPAFTEQEPKREGAAAAATTVRAHGYTPNDTAEYHPSQTLRVLVGTRTGSADGYGQQAFFFVGPRFIGTDAKQASAKVKVVSQGDTEVTLVYPLYRPNDPLCCPGAGQAKVRFQLNNGRLQALDPIPPASSKSQPARS